MSAQLTTDLRGIWLHLPEFGAAAIVTLCLAAMATPASSALGIVLVLGKTSASKTVRALSTAYVELFRNVPGLIVIYFVYFLLPMVDLPLSPFVCAVVALAAQHAAYFCEIYRGSLTAIGPRQVQAARALGMRRLQIMRWILLPQVFRDAIPQMGNEVVLLMLNTAVASTIGVRELTETANTVGESTAATFSVYVFVGIVYLVMTAGASGSLRWAEHKWRLKR
jgi:His/Glu/Gln/Arg/opine family amino acid ABC transporter permease subunit